MYVDPAGDYDGVAAGAGESSFFDSAISRIGGILNPTRPSTPADSATPGGMLAEAIYQYGRGKIDQAREKAVGAFLMTTEGRKLQSEGARQTVSQYMPIIIIGAVLLLFGGYFLARK